MMRHVDVTFAARTIAVGSYRIRLFFRITLSVFSSMSSCKRHVRVTSSLPHAIYPTIILFTAFDCFDKRMFFNVRFRIDRPATRQLCILVQCSFAYYTRNIEDDLAACCLLPHTPRYDSEIFLKITFIRLDKHI